MDPQENAATQPDLICPACAHGNPGYAVFCQGCGSPLRHAAQSAPAASLNSPLVHAGSGPVPDQVRALQDQVASLQGQLRDTNRADVDSAVRTAVRAARQRHLLMLVGLIVVIGVLLADTGTPSNIFGLNCRGWGFSGNDQSQHGLLICVN
ncbi:MAG TPA: hypothetical protein VNL71_04905 [Chloroflexota bacterium]|nr:hypothetical protein [Chloroflexota bacterium]